MICSDDDKRLQTFDKITTYPHGTKAFKVCKCDILMVMKYKGFLSIEQTIVAKCTLNRSVRYCNGEIFSVKKYKDFFLNNKNHIKKMEGIFDVLTANCIMNRSLKFSKSKMLSKIITFDGYANEKKKLNMIQNGHTFQTIQTEY